MPDGCPVPNRSSCLPELAYFTSAQSVCEPLKQEPCLVYPCHFVHRILSIRKQAGKHLENQLTQRDNCLGNSILTTNKLTVNPQQTQAWYSALLHSQYTMSRISEHTSSSFTEGKLKRNEKGSKDSRRTRASKQQDMNENFPQELVGIIENRGSDTGNQNSNLSLAILKPSDLVQDT